MANVKISDLPAASSLVLTDVLPIDHSGVTQKVNLSQIRGGTVVVTDYGAACNGTTDDSAAWAAAVTALGTNGGVVLFPAGTRSKGNITITQQNVMFKAYSFSRNASLNMQLIPAVAASPVISVGDGTTLCTGFQTDGIALDGLGTGAIGLKINGAAVCSYRNFSSQGFTDAGVRITSSATQPTTYQFFDIFDISANSSVSAIGLDILYGSQSATALYFSNGTIGAQSGSKFAYQVTGAVEPVFTDVWIQVAASGKGGSHITATTMGKIRCSSVTIDSSTSTDVLVTFDANHAPSDFIRGTVNIDGKISMPGGSTTALGAGGAGAISTIFGAYPYMARAQIGAELDLLYLGAGAWNEFDQVNDQKCRLFRQSTDTMVLDVTGGAAGASIDLRPNATGNVNIRNASGTANLQFIGSAGTSSIAQGANDLVLTPVAGNRVQLAGTTKVNSGFGIQSDHQTTVGAAGGASALPGTPTGYAKIIDVTGTLFVVPYYAAS